MLSICVIIVEQGEGGVVGGEEDGVVTSFIHNKHIIVIIQAYLLKELQV